MSSHDPRPWQNMEEFDLEEALRIFCDTSIRNFLWGMWHEHRRAKILENKADKQRQIINRRDDRISELNNSVQALERMSEDRLMHIKELHEREGELEERILQLEMAYDDLDREYKAVDDLLRRNTVDYGQQLSQLKTDYEDRGKLIEMLNDNISCPNEDVGKLKIQIAQLEEDKERILEGFRRLAKEVGR